MATSVFQPVFKGSRRRIVLRLVMNGILQAASMVGSMLLVRHAFDVLLNPVFDDPEVHLFEMTDVLEIALFAVALLSCTGLAAWLRLSALVDAEKLGQGYVHRLRLRIFDRMSRFAPRALSRRSTGAASLRFAGDLSAIRRWVSLGLARIVVAGIVTVLSVGVLALLDPYLAGCSFVVLMIGLGWNLYLGPRMQQAVSEARRLRGRLAGNINDKIQSYVVIQAFNQQKRERQRFRRQSQLLADAMIDRARASGRMRATTDGSAAASMGLVLSLGALEVFRGMTTAGNVVAAMAVVGFLSTAFRELGRVHEYFQDYRVSREKIEQFLRTRTLKGRSPNLPELRVQRGELELKGVALQEVLKGVDALAPGGSRIALVGDNGAGKSTLLHVVARLIDPDAGQVLIDGQDIFTCNLESVRRAIGMVSADLPLLRGSVRYNLCYRWRDAPQEEVAKIVETCGLQELLDGFPEGENFRLLEGGKNLSLGQRHRLAVARALLGGPRLLIIDEIDANLDATAAGFLDHVLDTFEGTVLMVTRFEERLARVDQVWALEDGRIRPLEVVGEGEKIPGSSGEH